MNLKKIVIALARPEESRNVGAVCRAMANNNISELRIIAKREDFDDEHVRRLALHAGKIWNEAKFFDSISQATKDCALVAGTTRRRGKKRKDKLLLPEEFAKISSRITGTKDFEGQKVAVVFGNERTGLTDEEFLECTMGVTIPTSQTFPSLNLSHAVQIISYHLFREEKSSSPGYTPVTIERLEKTVSTISENLKSIGFFKIAGQTDMENFWKGVFSRAALSEGEAAYIEKIFTKISGLASKNQ
ncbi:RNA methyltransferase [Treponema pectinovorum]|uniref:RNA methyltransferase n=1 Tax=Treponema pectinovorum TaxID=164 RepID=UPI0011CC82F4|nr:RNA methyltransferase [Treponema pectinovorum]